VIAAIGESGEGKSAFLNLVLNSPGERKKFLEESELPELCTTQPRVHEGLWRGDPYRPVTVVDTPGLGGEDGREDDEVMLEVSRLLEQAGGVHALVVVIRAGQSRFLGQHQQMFKLFEKVFGEEFWANCIIDVSHSCDVRNKRNFDSWMERLATRFPKAHEENTPKVFINTEEMENDTLEEIYGLCRGKLRLHQGPPKVVIHSSNEDISLSIADEMPSRQDDVPQYSSRPSSSLGLHSTTPRSRSPASRRPHSTLPPNVPEYSLPPRSPGMLLDMPPLPSARSPLPSRRRTLPSYASAASPSSSAFSFSSTPRTPRLSRTHYSSTEDFSYSASSTPRLTRSSYSRRSYSREPSPSSYSRHGSRETSPSPPSSSSTFTTIGLPTYLRTCTMYGKPFTKAMRAGRLLTKHAEDGEVERMETAGEVACLPSAQQCTLLHSDLTIHLIRLACQATLACPAQPLLPDLPLPSSTNLQTAEPSQEPHSLLHLAAALTRVLEANLLDHLPDFEAPTQEIAKRKSQQSELELMCPEQLVLKNAFNLVKKALLPKIKYHWDQGFKQGANGWEKCPVIKLKIKYGEEDQDLLPPALSVEGGAQCETKQVKLDSGKAKCKLRAAENKPVRKENTSQSHPTPSDSDAA